MTASVARLADRRASKAVLAATGVDLRFDGRSSEELRSWLANVDRALNQKWARIRELRTAVAGDPLRPAGIPWTLAEEAEHERLTGEVRAIEAVAPVVRRLVTERNAMPPPAA
jgi:hypothetical protein